MDANATISTSVETGQQNTSTNFTTEQQNTGQQYSDSDNSDSSQLQTQPTVAINEILMQNNNLLKATLKELKYLRQENKCMRREIEELKTICTSNSAKTKSKFSLHIPRSTAESFLELEEQVKTEDGENALV